ncbi:MAG: hypothetical protein JNK14_06520 [Chitinophagaceae bacterium]|nr:hypothetical protein [Chitinophagaceae bacterium]
MKKTSVIKMAGLISGCLLLSLLIMQCTKVGVNAKVLDRSMSVVPDSGIFAAFYDTTVIAVKDVTPDVNDRIIKKGVRSIIKEYCASSGCHGGAIKPDLLTYSDIMRYVSPGNASGSKLWEYITTNDFNKAMPPVNSNKELSITDKTIIHNWIANGAKEFPALIDYRAPAIRLIVDGCSSANCHNQATATGAWARKGLIAGLTSADTSQFIFTNPATGVQTFYCQLTNVTLRNQVWNSYKDSVKKFYSDTVAFASFRPYKTFTTPISASSTRGPLNNYDDILLDILYPKSARSNSSVQYTDPVTGARFYAKGNYLNVSSSMVSRVDSTVVLANPFTGVFASNHQGDMAYGDGGLKPSEVALIKAWYFADPNIPAVWKYGNNNSGIFKYRKSGNIIRP